jgi:hypothetical protein
VRRRQTQAATVPQLVIPRANVIPIFGRARPCIEAKAQRVTHLVSGVLAVLLSR